MEEIIKESLRLHATRYLKACENDLEEAKARLERANKIVNHISSGKDMRDCPLPSGNETSDQIKRYAASLDTLIIIFSVKQEREENDNKS